MDDDLALGQKTVIREFVNGIVLPMTVTDRYIPASILRRSRLSEQRDAAVSLGKKLRGL